MASDYETNQKLRGFFAWIAVIALLITAIYVFFPYGPSGPADSDETTNPFYLRMSGWEQTWRFVVAGILVGCACAVMFTIQALKDEKYQTKYWQDTFRDLQSGKQILARPILKQDPPS